MAVIIGAARPMTGPVTGFTVSQYAGFISAFAGVLGAVIVTAVALRLGNPPREEQRARTLALDDPGRSPVIEDLSRPLLTMRVAIISALLGAYGFAVIAATPHPRTTGP